MNERGVGVLLCGWILVDQNADIAPLVPIAQHGIACGNDERFENCAGPFAIMGQAACRLRAVFHGPVVTGEQAVPVDQGDRLPIHQSDAFVVGIALG